MIIFGGIGGTQKRFARTLTGGTPIFNGYYLSTSGSDTNDGRSQSTPWRTLAKAQQREWLPADTLFLRRGDTWTETFMPAGNGAFDLTTYNNTYASSYTSALASYLAGSYYAGLVSTFTSDGYSSTAAALATTVCEREARADAMIAARNAAQRSSQWITMATYGTGARPKIAPGAGSANSVIEFARDGSWTGGWKFVGLEIRDAACVGIDAELTGTHQAHGLWVSDSLITNITGMPVPTSGNPYPSLVPHFGQFCACGVELTGVDHVFFDTTYITECDEPLGIGYGSDYVFDYCWTTDSLRESNFFSFCQNVLVQNSVLANLCYLYGFYLGASGTLTNGSSNIIHRDCDLGTTRTPSGVGDGMALDFESQVADGTLLRCNVHDNSGEGMLKFENPNLSPPGDSGTVIVDTTFSLNGYRSPSSIANVLRYEDTSTDAIIWARNQFRKSSAAQKLFGKHSRASATTTLTDTPDPAWIFGASNVVIT